MTEEQAEQLIAEVAELTDDKYLKIEPFDDRYTVIKTPDMVWQIETDAGSSFAFEIWGETKADVAAKYLDHLIHVYSHNLGRLVPTKPSLKRTHRDDHVWRLKASLVLASLGVLKERYLGT